MTTRLVRTKRFASGLLTTAAALTLLLTGCGSQTPPSENEGGSKTGGRPTPSETPEATQEPTSSPTAEPTSEPAAKLRAEWDRNGPDDYTFVVDSRCGERLLIGKLRVTVTGGEVTDVEGLDTTGSRVVETLKSSGNLKPVPSIDDIFQQIDAAQNHNWETVAVELDPEVGYPTSVSLDDEDSVDEELCYRITDFTG